MGDVSEAHEALADEYKAGLITADGTPVDGFDVPDEFDTDVTAGAETVRVKQPDPARPETKRGRYSLPNPENGKSASWQRVTNFVKLTDDTYHLELWKQRNVLRGAAILVDRGRITMADLMNKDVKLDREWLNNVCTAAQDAAEAFKMADEGTALHTSTELVDYAGGDLNRCPVHHRTKVRMYLDALALHGLSVVPDMIERVTVSTRYGCAGKFDRIYRLLDGSYVIGDLKTGDSIDLSLPSIAGQLQAYEDGVNAHGIFDGQRYDETIKVRTDFAIVVHLPSTRDEVSVHKISLDQGREINAANLTVRAARKIKAKHVAEPMTAAEVPTELEQHAYWLEQLNAAYDRDQLIAVAARARAFGHWNERLAGQARVIAGEMAAAQQAAAEISAEATVAEGMGS